jgi:hypothetical protein
LKATIADDIMKSLFVTLSVAVSGLALAPAARASEPAPVQGWNTWSTSQNACVGNGPSIGSIIPIVIGNYSDTAQTGSVTIANGLPEAVQLSTSFSAAAQTPACWSKEGSTNKVQQNFTVPAFGSTVVWASFWGYNANGYGQPLPIGFGGAPSGTRGAGWFDLTPNFGSKNQYSNLVNITVNYSGTGGTNGSNQNNFNLVDCNVGANTVGLTPNILTPYSSGQAQGMTYQAFQPICAAWFPQGTMVTNFSSTPQSGVTAKSAQVNGGTVSFAGTGYQSGMTISYQNFGTSDPAMNPNAVIPLSSIPGSAPFLTVNSAGEWAAMNIPNGGNVNLLLGSSPNSPIIATVSP